MMAEGSAATIPIDIPAADGYPWPAQGQWIYEDYLRLPDDGRRYEIIELAGISLVTSSLFVPD